MRVLLTNNTLAGRAGTELYVFDVACRLRQLGHEPMAFSTQLGEVAEALRGAGIPVVADLNELPFKPDIIHGQHHLETMLALLSLPSVPAIYFCHGALPWEEAPPVFPRILQYVAVDEACRERVLQETGVSPEKIKVVLNFVDLEKFQPRPPLPGRPRRALVFSNYISERNHLKTIREACVRCGIELDARGMGVNKTAANPDQLLPSYDLVFGVARSALEAMAVGVAVVICNAQGCGQMVTAGNFDSMRPWNFGFRTAQQPITVENLVTQIRRYNAADATSVRDRVRAEAGLLPAVAQLEGLYKQVIAAAETGVGGEEEIVCAGNYLRWLLPLIKQAPKQMTNSQVLKVRRRSLNEQLARKADKLARWLRKH